MQIALLAFIYILAAAFISREGRHRHLGGKKALYCSLLLTPVVGLIITLCSTRYDVRRYQTCLRDANLAHNAGQYGNAAYYYDEAAYEYELALERHPKLDTPAARQWITDMRGLSRKSDAHSSIANRQ